MVEFVYYQDGNVSITTQRVKLGEKVYDLKDVRYAGVIARITKGKVHVREAALLAVGFTISCVFILFLTAWFSIPTSVSVAIYPAFFLVATLAYQYLGVRKLGEY